MSTSKLTLQATLREVLGKKNKNLRKQGKLPSSIYGYKGNFNIIVDKKEFEKIFDEAGHTTIVKLNMDNALHNVFVDEVQIDPVTREYIHVTFREIKMDEEITTKVPVVLINEDTSIAVKEQGLIVVQVTDEIEVRGLPEKIPHEIVVDVKDLRAGESISVGDIQLPEGISLVREEDKELTVATTSTSTTEEAIDVNAATQEILASQQTAKEEKVDDQ
ncbi:MAG: 50S ribosomal protein L25 [Candidatus Dojkabacteria bacterium]|nr:50S ribosomal protein L25 [Candidatus Dojkabacteria bacterium]